MSEVMPTPKKGRWAVHFDRTAADLTVDLAASGYRLISIKSYLDGVRRLYTACSIENIGVTTNWNPRITPGDLAAQLAAEDGRLISLDAYVEDGKTLCAAVWVKNDGRWWDWRVDITDGILSELLRKDAGMLTCLRLYDGRNDTAPYRLCAAIWTKDDGRGWSWSADIDGDDLYYQFKNGPLKGQALVSYDSFVDAGKTRFAYVSWNAAAPDGWYWWLPVPGPKLADQVRGLCCYPFDVCRTYPADFAIVQYAYPPIAHPNAKTLLTLGGTGVITGISEEVVQLNSITATVANSSGSTVNISRAVRFFPGPGGWCWFIRDGWNAANPGDAYGAPPTGIVNGATRNPSWVWNSSNSMEYTVTQVEASDGTFQQQEFSAFPLVAAGGPTAPPLTDIVPPAYVGFQGPLEILRMTDNRRRLELKGQVVNFAGRTMHIRGIHIDLLDPAGKSVYHADLPLEFKLDFDENATDANEYEYDKANPKHLLSPLPRFRHVVVIDDLPGAYTGGSLEIALHIQTKNFYADADADSIIGTMECFHNRRVLPVAAGAILQIASPVKGRFKWGNGPGAEKWHAHWYPAARYAYDIVKVDEKNSELKPDLDGTKNENYLSWGEEIRSASDGKVIFMHDSEPDHLPDAHYTAMSLPVPPHPDKANVVVVQDGSVRYLYVHLQQGSARVRLGDTVTTGQVLGLIGNSGNSSGPHLHFGAFTHEPIGTANPAGVLRPIAISLTPRNATVTLPVTVPLDGAFLDTP